MFVSISDIILLKKYLKVLRIPKWKSKNIPNILGIHFCLILSVALSIHLYLLD